MVTELGLGNRMYKNMKGNSTRNSSAQPSHGRRVIGIAALIGLALGASLVSAHAAIVRSADTFGSGENAFTIDFVTIGNPGNSDDTGDSGDVYGGVPYLYQMGVTEVAEDWILKATEGGMTDVTAGAYVGAQPAGNVLWYEAAVFVNWLNTSTGHQAAYNLDGLHMSLWSGAEAWQLGGQNLYRHRDSHYFLPNEDEWYKAAYHKNDGITANYWDYATGSNTAPVSVTGGTEAGTAVYYPGPSAPAAVNNSGGLSPYGTMGQNGNVSEWIEGAFDGSNDSESEFRATRGAAWNFDDLYLRSSTRILYLEPSSQLDFVGFRVASIPEPSSAALILSAGTLAVSARRRRHCGLAKR